MQCSVYDNIFKSFLQPLIGVFTIPIGDILQQKQRSRQSEMEQMHFIIGELTKIMEEAGAITYNIQSAINEVEDVSFRSTIQKQKELVQQTMKTVTDTKDKDLKEVKSNLARPLLLNLDSDEQNPSYRDLKSGDEVKS